MEYSWHIDELIKALNDENFSVEKIDDVELLTIRNYTDELYDRYASDQDLLVRQSNPASVLTTAPESRSTDGSPLRRSVGIRMCKDPRSVRRK